MAFMNYEIHLEAFSVHSHKREMNESWLSKSSSTLDEVFS